MLSSAKITLEMYNDYIDGFSGIGYFKGTFLLQIKKRHETIQGPTQMHGIYTPKAFEEKLECLLEQQIIITIEDETSEWCGSFCLVPRTNGMVHLCFDPARPYQVLIRPVYRGPTVNGTLSSLTNVQYLTLIDASSGYQYLKLDKTSSYLTTVECHFSRYRYARLSFSAAPVADLFQYNIDEIFKELPSVFGMMDDIYRPGPQLYRANWLSRHNHTECEDKEITGINMNINAIKMYTDTTECMMAKEIRHTTQGVIT